MTEPREQPAFYCDAMLGGLARWLRAAGYDARYDYGIDDSVLLQRARDEGRLILSSDGPLFMRKIIKQGTVRALFVPRGMSRLGQLHFVMKSLNLRLLRPRCMACGGELAELQKHEAIDEAPPLAYKRCGRFWRCLRCGRLLWNGTHWKRVEQKLLELAG
ncbi:MAG: hypothetical protein GXY38_07665 [Planctomycetes bacterium]|jgi:uncharacterized protein with PIN domain|nr:hypothetical protein [Planctomycetota bacterium]